MTYAPVKVITVTNHTQLSESTDLTPALSTFIGVEAYLVVTQNTFDYFLSLGNILNFASGLNTKLPIGTALASKLSDAFVAQFKVTNIPSLNSSGFYPNRLSVFNPGNSQEANFQIHYTSVSTPTVQDDNALKGYLDDLSITAPDYDMTYCLAAVNGVFHKTALLNNVLYILDGNRTIRLSGRRDICIVDTKALGGHTIIPLTTSNVATSAWQQPAVVTLQQSIVGNVVFAVIDGYFYHLNQNVIQYADAMHLKLKTNKMPLIQQFRHNPRTVHTADRFGPDATQNSRKYTDAFASLYLNNRAVASSELETQAFQYSRLTHYHSFLVVMNTSNLYTLSNTAIPTGTPQFYEDLSTRVFSGMLNYGCGLSLSYLIKRDNFGRKSIFVATSDNSPDYQLTSLNPPFIPSTSAYDPERSSYFPATFIDYVSV